MTKITEEQAGQWWLNGTSSLLALERFEDRERRARAEIKQLRTWVENVATDAQLDAPVSALGGQTGRQLLSALNTEEKV